MSVSSPCISVCVIEPETRICTGCYRTLDEIAAWSKMSEAARLAVMETLADRAPSVRNGSEEG